MIAGYGSKPVFQYKFRPLAQDRRAPDGGFCVILYENRILSFSTYDVRGAFIDELCFSFPGRVIQCFYGLLRNASAGRACNGIDRIQGFGANHCRKRRSEDDNCPSANSAIC